MNITSILLKKVILEADFEIWAQIRQHYLPTEYHKVYTVINNYFESNKGLPSFEALKLSIRSNTILDKIYAIEAAEIVDLSNAQLLEFLKNEYTQEEIMAQISRYLDDSIMLDSAAENLQKLQEIIFSIEEKVDLKDPAEDMNKIELFHTEEELDKCLKLGLNAEYDNQMRFAPGDYILIGGRRGSGKSLSCANIAVSMFNAGRSSLYFTIEMSSRATLQRMCSIATGVPAAAIRTRNLSISEWNKVAKWWASRFEYGEEVYQEYCSHKDFDKFHKVLTKLRLKPDQQLDVIYDPSMTTAKIKSELDKKMEKLNPSVILVDYVNKVRRNNHRNGQFDWTEQIEVSNFLKQSAQEYGVPLVSPYQIDASGEARFSKGLLDSADAAFTLNPWNKEDECITFTCVKMRDYDEVSFSSKVNWATLKIGPETAEEPSKKKKTEELVDDLN